jgi:hypothetical protein
MILCFVVIMNYDLLVCFVSSIHSIRFDSFVARQHETNVAGSRKKILQGVVCASCVQVRMLEGLFEIVFVSH